jgi:hypothetical protein
VSHTTGKPEFAVRENLCRAPERKHTTKRIFAVRLLHGARQKKCSAKKYFAVRFFLGARQTFLPPPDVTLDHNR